MKLMLLGSGQDDGIPHTACYCAVCQKAREHPSGQRFGPSIAIFDTEKGLCYLIDASPDLKYQLDMLRKEIGMRKGNRAIKVSGIFLTHAHVGHCLGLLRLGREAMNEKELPVFCTQKMKEFISENYPFAFLVENKNIALTTITSRQELEFDGFTCTPVLVPHRNEMADTVGYIIKSRKRVLYVPDVDEWTDEIIHEIEKADLAFIDGTFYSRTELPRFQEVPHPPILETIERLEGTQKAVYFTHINHTNPVNTNGKDLAFVEKKGFKIAHDGLLVDI